MLKYSAHKTRNLILGYLNTQHPTPKLKQKPKLKPDKEKAESKNQKTRKPETRKPENQKTETRNQKPETRNQKTRKPENRNQIPNTGTHTRNLTSDTGTTSDIRNPTPNTQH
jgi:outer membrane biosynthesis protein TonB